jgi:hypothetical protein
MWRPADNFNTVGRTCPSHQSRDVSHGVCEWEHREAQRSQVRSTEWETDSDGNRDVVEKSIAITEDPAELVKWLEKTWQMIDKNARHMDSP